MTSSQRDLAPRALHMLRNFLATRSEELQRNKTTKIILYSFSFYCYQSKQVIASVNWFCGLISKREFDDSKFSLTRKFLPHHYFLSSLTESKDYVFFSSRLPLALKKKVSDLHHTQVFKLLSKKYKSLLK